ncbi:Hypothetical protein PP7435_CHR1-0627 [Komagataella phaffii CBS 7435]|uniref:Oxo-4-hydroxy-4-carboxy-5-ureidoimidazoline decarboxylase domain-containing protein n=2 Tax=Komagataella phaffii TaxID=460519 RepID=C4QWR0_KOMPG|nr:Hypothetical protein PAS_chr1-1_0306 [Komagataella phaffii GS115]AOA61701.1 GQ67_02892T0 [Komagataella phaffii]CAH2446447.1 Hypothetical protein BQ9382_C1-3220 [Komagataella phaffii CBS 7435]AOA66413.1 GQ68_02355T0 [Komagataella phaffii GS115]CAY67683.1 Hypothetical protein PAS_chr1-1_0306 [Komagataella phaffii GS115]CCA36775.1 Hypothetical protein PP7435_CHR1-0627 [Komagataella phaffii CBS 7435]
MAYRLPPIDTVRNLPTTQKIQLLAHLFEPCDTLTQYIIPKLFPINTEANEQPFKNYKELIDKCHSLFSSLLSEINSSADPELTHIANGIIGAHPRLGPQKGGSALSSHSNSEQKSLAGSSAEETARLVELNESYEKTFPGLRYVVFVNGRSRPAIMNDMVERIFRNDIKAERQAAIDAMCDIAWDRAKKLQSPSSQ